MLMITTLALAWILAPVPVDMNIVYAKPGGEEVMMDIHQPRLDADTVTKAPAVVLIHGGGWIAGQRSDIGHVASKLAEQGFVVANISYRLAPKHKFPAFMHDAQTAVRFLRANSEKYGIDPNRIGSMGFSAGAHMAVMLGTTESWESKGEFSAFSSKVKAVFNVFGPIDMSKTFPPAVDNLFLMVLGKKKAEAAEEIKRGSPITYINKNTAPIFTLHGTKDDIVPVEQASILKGALDKAGVANETVIVDGMRHGINESDPKQVEGVAKGIAWLKKHLGL